MDTFEDDLVRWEELLEERKLKANEERKGLPSGTVRKNRNTD
jgi:hypothetical protein